MLAVVVPTRFEKACLGPPTVREQSGMTRKHPREINALVNLCGETHDLPVVTKTLARGQHTREQQRRVNRRDFALPTPLARLLIDPMIEPAMRLERALGEETERRTHTRACFSASKPTISGRDANGRQPETCGGTAGDVIAVFMFAGRRAVCVCAVEDETCLWVSLLPEVAEGALLKVYE